MALHCSSRRLSRTSLGLCQFLCPTCPSCFPAALIGNSLVSHAVSNDSWYRSTITTSIRSVRVTYYYLSFVVNLHSTINIGTVRSIDQHSRRRVSVNSYIRTLMMNWTVMRHKIKYSLRGMGDIVVHHDNYVLLWNTMISHHMVSMTHISLRR